MELIIQIQLVHGWVGESQDTEDSMFKHKYKRAF